MRLLLLQAVLFPAMLLSCAAALPVLPSASDICINAPPAANFTNTAYEGTWYEIAKYQTAGGAFFERNCVCTQVEVSPFPAPSADIKAHFSCRDKVPSGKFLNATGRLYDEAPPGKWMQKLMVFVPPVSYTIVAMGQWQGEEYVNPIPALNLCNTLEGTASSTTAAAATTAFISARASRSCQMSCCSI
jgi:apolipoprotein D and lipocalin family protein